MSTSNSNFSFTSLKDTSRIPITIGFVAVLLLISALVTVSLTQFSNINDSLSSLVEETHIKLQAANSMRDAIRLRADSLKKMRLLDDPFQRDKEFMNYIDYSGIFRFAREKLKQIPVNPKEVEILSKMTDTIRLSQPVNDQVAFQLFDDSKKDDTIKLIEEAEALQHQLLTFLDELVNIENQNAKMALVKANGYYENTRYTLFALAAIVFTMVIAIAIIVTRLVGIKNKQVSYQAMHDPLTNLFNRCYFEQQIYKSIELCKKEAGQHVLLYMDLDQFKVVNDTCGHIAGDELLKQITALIQNKVRERDTLARLGGDEFGLLLKDCDVVKASLLAEELRNLINEYRFFWDDKIFAVGVSIGIAPINNKVMDLKEVLIAADSACFAAKDAGRNLVHVYDPEDQELIQQEGQIQWMSEITAALEEDRMVLYAQSIKALAPGADEKTLTYEILIRLQDRQGKLYPPGAFLPAAERYGQITNIDRWVIKNTFSSISKQKECAKRIIFSINLSGRSLADDDFKQYLHTQFSHFKIDGKQICFEITETAAIASFDKAQKFIIEFQKIGCQFSLDDFGSGLSSFAYLKQFPVDILKIDGMFVQHIDVEPIDFAMVKSINELAHLYGKKTVAEYVESDTILEKVENLGIDFAQGYGISHPVELAEIVH